MIGFMNGGQPCRRYKADLKKQREEEEVDKLIMEQKAEEDKKQEKTDLKIELAKMRKKVRVAQSRVASAISVPARVSSKLI